MALTVARTGGEVRLVEPTKAATATSSSVVVNDGISPIDNTSALVFIGALASSQVVDSWAQVVANSRSNNSSISGKNYTVRGTVTLTEEIVRTQPWTISVALDGDYWLVNEILADVQTFLASTFSSQSSRLAEPTGFEAMLQKLLQLETTSLFRTAVGSSTVVDGTGAAVTRAPAVDTNNSTTGTGSVYATLDSRYWPAPRIAFSGSLLSQGYATSFTIVLPPIDDFDINDDETVVFALSDATLRFLRGTIAPEPLSTSFVIRAVSRVFVAVVDTASTVSRTFRSNPQALAQAVAGIFSLDSSRVFAQSNATALTDDGKPVLNFWFQSTAARPPTRLPHLRRLPHPRVHRLCRMRSSHRRFSR
jgi:hypothetical protein